jgi:zinc transporter, ZIP family
VCGVTHPSLRDVVVEQLIPESHREGNVDLATVSLMLGFAVKMVLEVALG